MTGSHTKVALFEVDDSFYLSLIRAHVSTPVQGARRYREFRPSVKYKINTSTSFNSRVEEFEPRFATACNTIV